MIRFVCDYAEGAHEAILRRMLETNLEQTPGYGEDQHCERARQLIRKAGGREDAAIHFLVGGTQTNTIVIASVLKPHEGVIAAETGHIACHETGAVEASGHKVITLKGQDGKLDAALVERYLKTYWADANFEHIVKPAMLYLSQPTECGTLYSKKELQALRAIADTYGLCLYVDGARLGYGLASAGNDVSLTELTSLADVFSIGGTKVGALFGEAVVFTSDTYGREFRYMIKQRGAMLAKGRLLGIQFETLFEDGLYMKIAAHADKLAMRIQDALTEKGIPLWGRSPTNQIFPILRDDQRDYLKGEGFDFGFWEGAEEGKAVYRICVSWAITEEQADALISAIRRMPC